MRTGSRLAVVVASTSLAIACAARSVRPAANVPKTTPDVRYCLSLLTEHNAPTCVHELTPEQQKKSASAYRLVFAAGKIARVERINGLGFPAEEPPGRTTSEHASRDGRVTEIVEKDASGVVRRRTTVSDDAAEIRWLDAQGRPQTEGTALRNRRGHDASGFKQTFDSHGRVTAVAYVDAEGQPATSVEGVSVLRLVHDAHGAVTEESYFDHAGQPTFNADGVHRIVHTIDALGQPVLDRYLDATGRPATMDHRVHAVRRVFDGVGNLLECSYQYTDGHPVRSTRDGAAMYRIVRDEHGAEVSRTYFDEYGKPTVSAYGYVTQRIGRNESGVPTEWRYLDAEGNPAALRDAGYSIRRRKVDANGRTLAESFFDTADRLALVHGYHQVEVLYDSRGNPNLFKYEDAHGSLIATRNGYAMERREYDVDRLVLTRYVDAQDRPVNPTYMYPEHEVYYRHKIVYDELGEISSEEFGGVGSDNPEPPPKPEPNCDHDAGQLTVDAQTRTMLAQLARLQNDAMNAPAASQEGKMPPQLRKSLPSMKRLSREIVRRLLASMPKRSTTCGTALAESIRSTINTRLQHRAENGDQIGGIGVAFQTAAGTPARWVASVSFGIPCGSDGSVYVFEEQESGPVLAMAVEAAAYADVGGGQEAPTARLSPTDASGHFFLVIAHAVPRCGNGVWRGLTYRVFDPGPSPDHQKKVLEEPSETRLEEDEIAQIETSASGFVIDSPPLVRGRRYVRHGNKFEWMPPFSPTVRNLADEWMSLRWETAAQLLTPDAPSDFKGWHARIRAAVRGQDELVSDDESPETEMERPWVSYLCQRWMDGKRVPGCKTLPTHIRFDMVRDGEGYRIASITTNP